MSEETERRERVRGNGKKGTGSSLRAAFTLLEVNLAIFIMATGILSMCALYSLGFRESRQSVEDVAAVSYADACLAPLVRGLSATNMSWSSWCQIGKDPSSNGKKEQGTEVDGLWPENGWYDYAEKPKDVTRASDDEAVYFSYRVKSGPNARAKKVFSDVLGKTPLSSATLDIPEDYQYALVASRKGAVVHLAFRIARRRDSLLSQPLIVSEVHFQGDPNK